MSIVPFPDEKHVIKKRIKDPKAIAAARKEYCERCGKKATGEPHHIRPRGRGGHDIPVNLIQLCFECHRLVHDGKISHHELIPIVAKRENLDVAEVYKLTGWSVPDVLPELPEHEEKPMLEELVQTFISLEEQERDCQWAKGLVLNEMIKMGTKIGWIASQVGASKSQIRALVKTYLAFLDESTRVPELSWTHHKICAGTKDPHRWIARAADEQMSTRQLRKAILEEEASDEIKSIAIDEEEKELREAEKVFAKVEEVIAKGSPGAVWLREKLRELVC